MPESAMKTKAMKGVAGFTYSVCFALSTAAINFS